MRQNRLATSKTHAIALDAILVTDNVRDFGRLPTIDGGRYKPMDSVARSNLMILTHRQDYYDDAAKKTYPATNGCSMSCRRRSPMTRC